MTVSEAGKEAPAQIILEGEMAKRGKKLKTWKTRWFVLYATSIANLDKDFRGWVKGVLGGILFEDVTLVSTNWAWLLRPRVPLSRSLAGPAHNVTMAHCRDYEFAHGGCVQFGRSFCGGHCIDTACDHVTG